MRSPVVVQKEKAESANQYTIHTDSLFDSQEKAYVYNTSITVDRSTGLVTQSFKRHGPLNSYMKPGDIDLSGLFVMPGFVDAHAHIFLHPYKCELFLKQVNCSDIKTVKELLQSR